MSKPVKIDLITGFLGAGKTTFLNKLLKEAYFGEKVALLENEFGEIPLDGTLLAGNDITIREIANGCICCTLQGNFIEGITALVETAHPDRIVIEPTGLAKLPDLAAALVLAGKETPLKINAVITVADAAMVPVFLDVGGDFYRQQLRDAKILVLSHVQELENEEELEEVLAMVRRLNDTAPIFAKDWAGLHSLAVLTAAEARWVGSPAAPKDEHLCDHEHHHEHDHEHDHQGHHHPHDSGEFSSCSVVVPGTVAAAWPDALCARMRQKEGGEVFRAKGLLHTAEGDCRFDYVYGKFSREAYDFRGNGFFVVIGKNLDSSYWQAL